MLTLCGKCKESVSEGRTVGGKKVLLDMTQRVFTPWRLGDDTGFIQTMLSFAEHRCAPLPAQGRP